MSPRACRSSVLLPVPAALRERVEAIFDSWRGGERPDARAALDRDRELAASKPAVVELAYEEFCLRREAGEALDPDVFADGFPAFRAAVRRQLRFDAVIGSPAGSLAAPLQSEIAAVFGAVVPPPAPARLRQPPQPKRWPEVGETLGDFTLVRPLGEGAFARVFLARESSTGDRPVVVKLALEGAAEARTLGRLAHPNIVPVLSCRRDLDPELNVLCMPFLGAATLKDVRDRLPGTAGARRGLSGRLILQAAQAAARPEDPPSGAEGPADPRLVKGSYTAAVLHMGAQLAEALAFVHQRGVLHRDLKPSNVLVGPDGRPRLLDFNLAADAGPPTARMGGTIPYAAPEQLRAMLGLPPETRGPPDGRADLFSLAVILYELLTGRHPFEPVPSEGPPQEQGRRMLDRLRRGCAPPRADDLDGPSARLLVRCLAYDPERRPAGAAEFAAGLRAYFAAGRRLRRWAARRPAAVAATVLAAGAVAWSASAALQPPEQPQARSAYGLGRNAFRAGRYDEAQDHFRRALAADPDDLRSRFAHACTLMRRGQAAAAEEATNLLTAAVADFRLPPGDPQEPLAQACQAYCDARLGNHAPAITNAALAQEAGFHSTALWNNRAYSHLRRGELKEAASCLAAIPQPDSNLPAVCSNRACLALKVRLRPPEAFLAETALDDVRRALDGSLPDRRLCQVAARLHALAAEDHSRRLAPLTSTLSLLGIPASPLAAASAALRDYHGGQLTAALRRAVVLGLDPAGLDANPGWKPAHGRADFTDLCKHPPALTTPPADSPSLIDPVDDLPE
jgi:Flp pilus assembly protein TadD